MDCDHPTCTSPACASTSTWTSPGALGVSYWCKTHAPDDETLEWFCAVRKVTGGCCQDCQDKSRAVLAEGYFY